MKTLSAENKLRFKDPLWYFLGEYSLGELTPEGNGALKDGLFFQTIRDMGIPPECLNQIEMTSLGFVKKATVQFKQDGREMPGRIRVFCQKKVIDDANPTNTPRPDHPGKTEEPISIIHPSEATLNGGWGYFIVERAGEAAGSVERSYLMIDLYVYKEGE